MAFRYFFFISCNNNNVPYGLRNNTTALSVRLASNLNKTSVDLHQCQNKQCSSSSSSADKSSHSINCGYNNLFKNSTAIGFLTSKEYFMQENKTTEHRALLFPEKIKDVSYLQPLNLESCIDSSNNNCNATSDVSLICTHEKNRKYSSSSCANNTNDVVKNNHDQNASIRKIYDVGQQIQLLCLTNTVRTIGVRQFSSKKDVDCDCPPVASRNLTSIDSASISHKPPSDVPTLKVRKKHVIAVDQRQHECPQNEERTTRADDRYKIKQKKSPILPCPKCPVPMEYLEGKPLTILKKSSVKEPLPKVKFDFIPNTCRKPPPDIPFERLTNLEGKDRPRIKCEKVEGSCLRSDDLAPKKIPNLLPMLMLRPKNNYVSIIQHKRAFSTLKGKYSIMSAIKNPWALSLLTANMIAFNYYTYIKPKKSVSPENAAIKSEIRKNLSQQPSKTLRKRVSNQVTFGETSDTSNKSSENTNQFKRVKREPRRNKQLFLQKKTLKKKSNKVTSKSGDNGVICKQTNVLPASKSTEKFITYSREAQYNNFYKMPNINNWDGQQGSIDKSTIKRLWKNRISDSAVLKNAKVSYFIYTVNNRTIHTSTGHLDKSDKKRKCTNKKCVKTKWPGLPPVYSCEKRYKPIPFQKHKCPYPSFSESGYTKDFQVCQCNDLPKSLQPRHKILRKVDLVKPAPPEWSFVDTDYEKKCVMEKLQMPPGETRTCDDFYCPPQHIGNEYLSEEEKPKKPKPPISCKPCKLPKPTKSGEFKRPPEATLPSSCAEKCNTDSNQPQKEISLKSGYESPKSQDIQPAKKDSSEKQSSSPKIKCVQVPRSQQTVRFASSSANTNVDPNKTKTLWEVLCSVFKENLSTPGEEIKAICRKLTSEYTSKSQNSVIVQNTFETQSCGNKAIESVPQNDVDKTLADLKFTNFFELLRNGDYVSSVNIQAEHNKQNRHICINLHKSFNTKSNSIDMGCLIRKVVESKKHCLKRYKSNIFDGKIRTRFSRLHSTTCSSRNETNITLSRSSFCQLSTSSNSRKGQEGFSNSWMQAEKTKPALLKGQPPRKSAANPDCRPESQHIKDSADDHECCSKKIKWLDCKTPTMKVCKEDRHQGSCKEEYVHPKSKPQKSPFPSFSECHPPFPKYRLTECEIQKRNILVAKQRIEIYSIEKPKHKYCVRCGTKCNKEFSTLASALHSLGCNHCKRYFCTSQKNCSLCMGTKISQNVMKGIKEEIKSVEAGDKELDSNSYYKLLKLLETYREDVVYSFFRDPYDNLPEEHRKTVVVDSQELDEIKVDKLYISFCKQIVKTNKQNVLAD